VGPIATKVSRRFGLKPTLLTGAVLQVCALISASFATRVWHLYLTQGALFGWGCGFQYIGGSGVIPQWFTKRRAFANSIASAGSGLGGMIWCLATGAMIETVGFRWSLRITAIVAFSVNVICALLMKDRNKHIKPNQRAFDITLFKNHEFALLLAWGFFSMLGYTILLFSLPNFATTIGLSQYQAAFVGAMVNLGMAVGRPVVGFYSDSIGGINMAAGVTFFGSLVCFFVWMFADSYGVLILAAILGGSVCGTFWATIPPLTSNAVGMKELPSGLSIVWTSVVIPCLFAEPIALSLEGQSNTSNKNVQIFAGAMFLGGAISLLFLRGLKVKRLRSEGDGFGSESSLDEKGGRVGTVFRRWAVNAFTWGKF
jgi:MFS family permease